MKTLIISIIPIIIFLFTASSDMAPAGDGIHISSTYSDTLESGSADSMKEFSIINPAKVISFTAKQLDTNRATSPDSMLCYNRVLTFYSQVDFRCCQDSVKKYLDFTYGSAGQIRSGWIFQPAMTGLTFQMANIAYRSNRRILIEVTITY